MCIHTCVFLPVVLTFVSVVFSVPVTKYKTFVKPPPRVLMLMLSASRFSIMGHMRATMALMEVMMAALLATAAEEHSVDQGVMVTGMQATELFRYTMEPDLPRL